MPLPEYIKKVRTEKHLSLRAVEERSRGQISTTYINQIEQGSIDPEAISVNKLKGLARGLDVPEEEIFRIARGLPAEGPAERFEFWAEGFDGKDLAKSDWEEIESVLRLLIKQKKQKTRGSK